jgi:hypothetical protein
VARLVSQIIAELRSATGDPCRSGFDDYLDKAAKVTQFRNDLAHSLWPVQNDGTLFGWRPDQTEQKSIKGTENPTSVGKSMTTTTSMAQIEEHIRLLVDLLNAYPNWLGRANTPHRLEVARERNAESVPAARPSAGPTCPASE